MTHPIPDHARRGAAAHPRHINLTLALCACVLGLLAGSASPVRAVKWDPIDPADLAAKESKTSPGADAEMLFVRYQIDEDNFWDAETQYYVRAKIYTEKGVEDRGRLAITTIGDQKARDIVGRVIKPDGTIYELKKEDIFENTLWRSRYTKVKSTRLAFPNLAPGDVVEYKWRLEGQMSLWSRWYFAQMEWPVREFQLRLKDLNGQTFIGWPNCANVEEGRRGGYNLTVRNLPAFEAEEFMPPEREFRSSVYLVKTAGMKDQDKQWREIGRWFADEFATQTAVSGAIKDKATELIAGAASDEEKLRRLSEFCHGEIVNFSWIDNAEYQKKRQKSLDASGYQTPKETLSRKYGFAFEIDLLFASLARAAGFEVRRAFNSAIDDQLNVRGSRGWAFMDRSQIAVRVGDVWRFFNPGDYLAVHPMLDWRNEGATALLCDKSAKEAVYAEIPRSPAAASREVRHGAFTLTDDGTLEGDVEVAWTGQLARTLKDGNWHETQEDIDKSFREEIGKRIPGAEITGLVWENLRSQMVPLKARYHVVVPGYAEQVGRRLLVRPGFFESGKPAVFAADHRRYPIAFPFAWQESDEISIQLPEGFELDQPSAPLNVGSLEAEFGAAYKIKYSGKTRVLQYTRDFSLGTNGALMFQAQSYPVIKGIFEKIHRSDTHAIMIKPKAAAQDAAPAAP